MEIVGFILVGLGVILSLVGGIWLLVVAFNQSVLWGLGYLLVPFVSLIFVIMHWGISAKPFGISILGSLLMFGGIALLPAGS